MGVFWQVFRRRPLEFSGHSKPEKDRGSFFRFYVLKKHLHFCKKIVHEWKAEWKAECGAIEKYFSEQIPHDTPAKITNQLEGLRERVEKDL